MAKIIIEQREYKDQNTGITTEYQYTAIQGKSKDGKTYEVQLKNLVQSEKMALSMIADQETVKGEVSTHTATEAEEEEYQENQNKGSFLD